MEERKYLQCCEGWKGLYQPIIDRCEKENVKIFQIKEKFGTLRIYIESGVASEELINMVRDAEMASEIVCEDCGKRGTLHYVNKSWLKVLCPDHIIEHESKTRKR